MNPLGPQMIEEYARSRGFCFLVDADANYLVRFRADDTAFDCWLAIDGGVASVSFVTRERFPADGMFALATCDSWNRTHRWPRAYTVEFEGQTEIVLDGYHILSEATTAEGYADFVDAHIAGAAQFWDELMLAWRLAAA